ncbi:MAG: putative LPS assembly protein LptD [Paludibacter sp.]
MGFSQDKTASTKQENKVLATDSLNKSLIDTTKILLPVKQKSNQIDAEIVYNAQDSIVFLGNGTGFLHGKSDITYKNINLKADFVRIKMDSSLIFAHGTLDSIGQKVGEPVFKEGESEYASRELTYNLKTKKGYIRQAVTQQGEGYVISDRTKKTSGDILCLAGGKYTTCDNHDHPDFYLSLSKAKLKPGGYIVTGPAHLVIADVPLPIAIPFGFFPFTDKYSSGVLMPTYVDELTRGFGLINGGYYFALSDYGDLELKGDIYTKGTWALSGNTTYMKRYKYRGSLSVSYREDVTGEKDMADYSKANNMSIRWSHSQDQKANPYFNFSSSVNFSTSGYNRSNINSYYNPNLNSENTKGSSVSFSQRFPESPFSISGSMLINQRTKDSTISLTLPNISISMGRIYPLKRKNAIGKERWYEKISMSYSGTMANSIDTKEKLLLSSSLTRDWRNGMRHSIPVSTTFNILKYINVSPSINYTERWYLQSIDKNWDNANQKVVTDTTNGFHRVYDFNMGVSASTKLYGFYMPIRSIFGDKIDRIRHVLTPSIGFSYMPDFGSSMWGYYDSYIKTALDNSNPTTVQYSHYEGSLYGTPGVGKSGNINFSLSNNVEMKVRNDNDTTGINPFTKVSLIDNLSVSGGYNLAADSMQWSQFSANLRLKLGKSYSLSLSGAFDPYLYALNSSGNPVHVNKLRWENGQFPRFLGTSTSYSYTLSNETFKKKAKSSSKDNSETNPDGTDLKGKEKDANKEKDSEKDKKKTEIGDDGYQKVTVPWSISASYSIRYGNTNVFDKTKMEYEMDFTHNLSFSGNLSLTTNWKFSSSTSYDFKAKQFTYTNINITRNLHCWTMTGSVVPFGVYKSYNVRIAVNASMLQDLKYEKQSSYGTNNLTWY